MKKLAENIYRIDRRGELEEAVLHYFQNSVFHSKPQSVPTAYSVRYYDLPEVYPYVVVMLDDDEREEMTFEYVSLAMFERNSEEDKDHLFEFNIRRVYLTSPYRVRESLYQIPAKDIFKALLALGQTHSRDEEYDLEVISWTMVR